MAKRKKSTTQKESLFNTGAYHFQTNNHIYDSAWDTGTAFPEVHNTNPTDINEHVSSGKNISNAHVVNATSNEHVSSGKNISNAHVVNTDIDEHLSSGKNINSLKVTNSTNANKHLSSGNDENDCDRWDSRYFGEEPPRSVESDGQLSIFFDGSYEAPDPDDFRSTAEYEAAWEQWKQDELRRQALQTNVLTEPKNLDAESIVLEAKQFPEETLKDNTEVKVSNKSFVLVSGGETFPEERIQNDASFQIESEPGVLIDGDAFFPEEIIQNDTSMRLTPQDTEVLKDTERFLNETYKTGRQRKGCLHKHLEKKTLKDGTVASYPRVIGARDPDNVKHWRWAYQWEEKVNGEWKNRTLCVPVGAVSLIIGMQNNYHTVDEIISFIKKSKVKTDKKGKGKAKKNT